MTKVLINAKHTLKNIHEMEMKDPDGKDFVMTTGEDKDGNPKKYPKLVMRLRYEITEITSIATQNQDMVLKEQFGECGRYQRQIYKIGMRIELDMSNNLNPNLLL